MRVSVFGAHVKYRLFWLHPLLTSRCVTPTGSISCDPGYPSARVLPCVSKRCVVCCRYKELRVYCETIPCICVANKIDVDYSVTSKAFAFPAKNGLPFYFVSAADGTNVVQVFNDAIKMAWDYKHGEKDFVAEVRAHGAHCELHSTSDSYPVSCRTPACR